MLIGVDDEKVKHRMSKWYNTMELNVYLDLDVRANNTDKQSLATQGRKGNGMVSPDGSQRHTFKHSTERGSMSR